jgi:hypothetical protein
LALEARNRHGLVLDDLHQDHLCTAHHTAHRTYSPTNDDPSSLYIRTSVSSGYKKHRPEARFGSMIGDITAIVERSSWRTCPDWGQRRPFRVRPATSAVVCTGNLRPDAVVMKSAKDGV